MIELHTKEDIVYRIDLVADTQRERLVVSPVRAFEYQAAEAGAKAYRDAGYQGDVPAVVSVWAEARGWTSQQAADDILAEAAVYQQALVFLRGIRLKAKYRVMDPAVTLEQARAIAAEAIEQMKALG